MGVGVSVFANKLSGIYMVICETAKEAQNCRSINDWQCFDSGRNVDHTERGQKDCLCVA